MTAPAHRRPVATTVLLVLLLTVTALAALPGSVPAARAVPATTAPAAASAVGPGGYVALPPTRVYDSQLQQSDDDKSQFPQVRKIRVLGRWGLPASGVAAVVVNVTAANPGGPGWLRVYASGTTPPVTSNLNWARYGANAAGLVLTRVGSDGMITIEQSSADAQTRIIVDLAGYVLQTGEGATSGQVVPVAPARILDTRRAVGVPGTAPVGAGSTVHLQVGGRGGVPTTGVGAALLTVTVTGPVAAGYVTAYPDGTARPVASNLNYVAGQTVPNLVLARLSADGKVALTTSAATHLVADVAGWVPTGTSTAAGSLTALAPSRILDTRTGNGVTSPGPLPGRTTLHLQVGGRGGVPTTGAGSVVLNLTATGPVAGGYLAAYPDDGSAPPTTSNVNYDKGQTLPNLVVVKLSADGRVAITTSATTHLVADVAGWLTSGWGLDSYVRYDGPWSGPVPGDQLRDARRLGLDLPPSPVTLDPSADPVAALWSGSDCDPDGRCVAVGQTADGTGRGLGAVRDPGATAWRVMLVDGATVLTGVRCPGGGRCYASGSGPGASVTPVFVLDEETSTWTAPVTTDRRLDGTSVDCDSPGSCVVVAQRDDTQQAVWTIVLRDGAWTVTSTPLPTADVHAPVVSVRCVLVDLCAVSGTTSSGWTRPRGVVILVRSGVPGAPMVLPTVGEGQTHVDDVACWSSTACLAVGWQYAGTQGSLVQPLALQISGDTWSPVSVPLPYGMESAALDAVDCTSAVRCVVGGGTAPRYPTNEGDVALVLTGSAAALRVLEVPTPHVKGLDTSIQQVQCAQTGRCYLSGAVVGATPAVPFVLHEAAG